VALVGIGTLKDSHQAAAHELTEQMARVDAADGINLRLGYRLTISNQGEHIYGRRRQASLTHAAEKLLHDGAITRTQRQNEALTLRDDSVRAGLAAVLVIECADRLTKLLGAQSTDDFHGTRRG